MAGGLKWVSLAVLGFFVVIGGSVALLGGNGDATLLNSRFKFSLNLSFYPHEQLFPEFSFVISLRNSSLVIRDSQKECHL